MFLDFDLSLIHIVFSCLVSFAKREKMERVEHLGVTVNQARRYALRPNSIKTDSSPSVYKQGHN